MLFVLYLFFFMLTRSRSFILPSKKSFRTSDYTLKMSLSSPSLSSSSSSSVIVLTGPTAVGKSAVARELCRRMDCEIVIADSVQVYKYMDIGANKPSLEEQQETPHHLIDVCEPGESCSSGDFVRMAVPAIEDILRRGKTPIVVGGSTMWTDWLIKGVPDAPKASKDTYDTIQQLLIPYEQSQDWDGAIQLLSKYAVDVGHAEGGVGVGVGVGLGAGISRNDWYRLRRALFPTNHN